jgi:hypothetical protein
MPIHLVAIAMPLRAQFNVLLFEPSVGRLPSEEDSFQHLMSAFNHVRKRR